MLQCVVVCCRVLQCVAVSCNVMQCVAVCCRVWQCVAVCCRVLPCVAVCCSVLQCAAVCCNVLAVCCSVLQREHPSSKERFPPSRRDVVQYVAVSCDALQCIPAHIYHPKRHGHVLFVGEMKGFRVLQHVAMRYGFQLI